MSNQLADYLHGLGAAILAVLDVLAAERRLGDPAPSVPSLLAAEAALDRAAQAFADAADALPLDSGHRPVGWDKPPDVSGVPEAGRVRVARAALRLLSAQYADESARAGDEEVYAEEQFALACRNLAADVAAKAEVAKPPPAPAVLPLGWTGDDGGGYEGDAP